MLKHKKLLSALLAAVMLFTVTGCGGTDDEAEDAGATSWVFKSDFDFKK